MIYSPLIPYVISIIALISWIFLLKFRGNFWRSDQYLKPAQIKIRHPPEIVIIVPARNEESTIGDTLTSLLELNYEGKFSIIVVNDDSEDNTFGAAKTAGKGNKNLLVINGKKLPNGWMGKMWAIAQGVEIAQIKFANAQYYLFTDADILHYPRILSDLAAKAQIENLALVSLMVKLHCSSIFERILIPAFIFFFQKLYPFAWVNDPNNDCAGAAGGCMLVNKHALSGIGGIKAIKDEIIDDCALAGLIKTSHSIWLGLTHSTTSLRRYENLADIWHMVCRTAFVQLDHSTLKLIITLFGMLILYVTPAVGILTGLLSNDVALTGISLISWTIMTITYRSTLVLYTRPTWEVCLLPIAALLFSAMTLDSARKYWVGNVPTWKGRQNIK
jgi:hopene-associated glycosyltransferase HpnB